MCNQAVSLVAAECERQGISSVAVVLLKEVAEKVRESPFSMKLPLVVLGFLSLIGGLIGVPHLFGGHEQIVVWLTPVVGAVPLPAGDHITLEIIAMATALGVSTIAAFVAFWLYARRVHPLTASIATERPWRWLYLRLLGKWHVDEAYEATVIEPIHWGSRVLLYEGLDKRIIDGAVNLVGWLARSLGFLGQLFQSGNIQRYLAIFVIGLAILMWGYFLPLSSSSARTDVTVQPVREAPAKAPAKVMAPKLKVLRPERMPGGRR